MFTFSVSCSHFLRDPEQTCSREVLDTPQADGACKMLSLEIELVYDSKLARVGVS